MLKLSSTASAVTSPNTHTYQWINRASLSVFVSIMNPSLTPLYFEPESEQGTCCQPEFFYSYTQKEEHSTGQTFHQPQALRARSYNLAKWMCFSGKRRFKRQRRRSVPRSSRVRHGSYSSDSPLWRPRDGARHSSQVSLGKYPGQVSHPCLRWLRAAPPLRRARSRRGARCRVRAHAKHIGKGNEAHRSLKGHYVVLKETVKLRNC